MQISDFGSARVLTVEQQAGPHADRSGTLGYGGNFGHADANKKVHTMKYTGTAQHLAPEILKAYDEVARKAAEDEAASRVSGIAPKAAPLVTFRGKYTKNW